MSDTATNRIGRPPKPDDKKVKPLNLKISNELRDRLDRIRDGRKWPAALQMLADKWDGLR